ncbi:MAG: hypothetical protein U1E36_03135 [Rickettsiales bacterium]
MTNNMKIGILCAGMALALTACDSLKENTNRAASDVGTWYDNTRYRVANYIYDPNRRPPEIPPAPPQRFCYRVQTDILCYSEPRADAKNRLVAGQDAEGYIESVTFENDAGISQSAMMNSSSSMSGSGYSSSSYGMTSSSSSISASPLPASSGLGGHYDAGPGVAPPLQTIAVGDAPAVNGTSGAQPFYYVQSPSVVDKMDGVKASYDTSKAKGAKQEPSATPTADAAPAQAEPVTMPPSLLDDNSVIKASASGAPTQLMSKN